VRKTDVLAAVAVVYGSNSDPGFGKTNRIRSAGCDPRPLPLASISKRVFVQNLSYENKFDLHEIEPGSGTHL